MNFKTKILTSVLAVGLTVALVGGSTMAWFTDSQTVEGATFKAGTVTIDDEHTSLDITGYNQQNVNPGDSFTADVNIVYSGTKPAKLRILLPTLGWFNDEDATDPFMVEGRHLTTENLDLTDYDLNPSDWRIEGGYAYYIGTTTYTVGENSYTLTGGIIPGTVDDTEVKADGSVVNYPGSGTPTTISFSLTGRFNGLRTDNKYQGKTFKIGDSTLEVVQATNDAPWTTPAA